MLLKPSVLVVASQTNFDTVFEYESIQFLPHIAKIKIDQNCKTHLQILDIWCKNVKQNCRDLKKKIPRCPFFKNLEMYFEILVYFDFGYVCPRAKLHFTWSKYFSLKTKMRYWTSLYLKYFWRCNKKYENIHVSFFVFLQKNDEFTTQTRENHQIDPFSFQPYLNYYLRYRNVQYLILILKKNIF